MSKGYVVFLVGLIGWLAALGFGTVFTDPDTESSSIVFALAFLWLALCFVTGALMIAGAKGYHWSVGLILGLTSPLGLLVLTLLPKRKWIIDLENGEGERTFASLPRLSSLD